MNGSEEDQFDEIDHGANLGHFVVVRLAGYLVVPVVLVLAPKLMCSEPVVVRGQGGVKVHKLAVAYF